MHYRHALAAILAVLVAGVLQAGPSAAGLDVKNAWLRWLPAGLPGAGYMTLTNKGPDQREVVGVSSPDFAEVGIHQTTIENGMSSMNPVSTLTVPPHATVRFAEGGYHLMLMRPKRELHPGDTVIVVLTLDGGRSMRVPFEVRKSSSQP